MREPRGSLTDASVEIQPFPIVGIGASAGGIPALEEFFAQISADANVAFVVVTHLSPDRESMLPQIIARHTVLPVEVAADGMPVRLNHVYVLGANAVLGIEAGRLSVRPMAGKPERNLIDLFFTSLAFDRGEGAIGIVLSGGGSDGTLGIKAIKERGGVTFAQVADGTKVPFPEMPSSAIATGLVDFMLPVDEMAAKLLGYTSTYASLDPIIGLNHTDLDRIDDADEALTERRQAIYAILRNQVGHDFSGYKVKTFLRRVQRRMRVLEIQTLDVYIERLRQDGEEVGHLFRDLLINVTNFFRDSDAFETLKATVIPKLFENRGADDTVRIWVPGCATGEEVFSLAILMREHMDVLRAIPRVQIFATDIDAPALAVARTARYPEGLLDTVSQERRRRFFVNDGSSYVVSKEVRDMCIFSPHSLIRDPPFSRIDLVSCRNLLIYFGPDIQSQVIPTFHYALRPGGYLFLGTSENISQFGELFTTLEKKHRIFQARDNGTSGMTLASRIPLFVNGIRPAPFTQDGRAGQRALYAGGTGLGPTMRQRVETHVLDHHAPAHVVTTHDGDVVYYSSRTGKYLEAAPGLPSRQLLTMARRGLRLDLRAALRDAVETRAIATRQSVTVEGDEGRVQIVTITVEPLLDRDESEPLLLVLFQDVGPSLSREDAASRTAYRDGDGAIVQLERDLRDTRERLQSMIEEYETALEELKSSNEELVSVNEELQSTNEELEASKEEMQSLNEELQTVNFELNGKLDDLDRVNADLHNLFQSTQIATVFLDRNLVIRSFTPTVSSFFAILDSDRGRPLTDLASRLDYPSLHRDVRRVIETGETREQQIERQGDDDIAHTHYLVRLVPYREADGAVAGVVVTFVDVTSLARAESRQAALVDELNHRAKNLLTVVLGIANQTKRRSKTPEAFYDAFSGRLMAMARSNELLSRNEWADVTLEAIVGQELAPHGLDRVTAKGPPIRFSPKRALSVGMVIHELATNAAKYGALAEATGTVEVTWSLLPAKGPSSLAVTWREQGGTPVVAPARKGFGLDLVAREIRDTLGGTVDVAFHPEGLRVDIALPYP